MEPVTHQQTNYNPYNTNKPACSAPPQPPTPAPIRNKRNYSVVESVFAWLCLIFGYIFCRVFPLSESPFGGFIFTLLLYLSGFTVLKLIKKKVSLMPALISLSAIILSFSLILTSNDFLHFFSYSYSLAVFGYLLYSGCGNRVKSGFTDLLIADFFKALIIMPFCSFGCMFKAMFEGKKKGNNKILLKILLGIGIAVVPTLIIFGLLSYDSDFTTLLNNIFDFDFDKFWSHLGSLILGVPLGLYLYGLFISSVDNKCKSILSEENSAKALSKMRIAPVATILAATIPILFLYVVFFISQWKYYISGFTGVLPEKSSYAAYAREGFFQLCTVAVINLIIITAVILFLKRSHKIGRLFLKSIVLTFSVATLILICTAVAKMIMYINVYGLTPKRVYSTWFMLLIALVFILISLKMFIKKLKVVALTFVITVSMFALIAIPNVDAFITKYNVNRYISGSLETVDLDSMVDLGTSAIPSLITLKEHLDDKTQSNYEAELNHDLSRYFVKVSSDIRHSDRSVFSYTVTDIIARDMLKKIGYF